MSYDSKSSRYECRDCKTFLGFKPADDNLCDRCRNELNEAYRLTYLIMLHGKVYGDPKAGGFESWFAEFVRYAKEKLEWTEKALATLDRDSYREYYEEGFTPEDAWWEEYQAAS